MGRMIALAVAALTLLVWTAGPAFADDEPEITGEPEISGEARAGEVVRETSASWRGEDVRVTYTWLRCDDDSRWWRACRPIEGASGSSDEYLVADADVGRRLRVLLTVSNDEGSDREVSEPTAAVAPRRPPPDDDGDDDGGSNGGDDGNGTPGDNPAGAPTLGITAPVIVSPGAVDTGEVRGARRRVRVMRPFPVVRIRGWLVRNGAMVRLLTVRAPRGVRVKVRCLGRDCPRKAQTRRLRSPDGKRRAKRVKVARFRAFEGFLPAGTRLKVRVTRPGWVGKHTTIRIRRGKAPTRKDRCLYPGTRRPVRCTGT